MSWLILIFTVLMFAWIAAGVGGDNCSQYAPGTPERSGCELGSDVGTGVAVVALFGVWFVGFIILSIIWFMTRPTRRICPVCGYEARKGQRACKKCKFDFAQGVQPPAQPSPS